MKIYYTVYKTTNIITNKIYIGQHQTTNLNDGYLGSGTYIKNAIKKYGANNFIKKILYIFDNFKEMNNMEKEIVDEEFILKEDNYNIALGGNDGCGYLTKGNITVKDKDGNTSRVPVNDPRYLSGELVGVNKGSITVKDKDGNTLQVDVNDSRRKCGELTGIATGKTIVEISGVKQYIDIDDPRIINGEVHSINYKKVPVLNKKNNKKEYIKIDVFYNNLDKYEALSKNRIIVKDKLGNKFCTLKDDPRYLNGELVGVSKGTFKAVDKNNKIYMITKNDPRYVSGELTGFSKGFKFIKNIKLNKNKKIPPQKLEKYLNEGWELGRIKKFIRSSNSAIIESNTHVE